MLSLYACATGEVSAHFAEIYGASVRIDVVDGGLVAVADPSLSRIASDGSPKPKTSWGVQHRSFRAVTAS